MILLACQKGAFLSMPVATVQGAERFAIVPHGPFSLPVAVRLTGQSQLILWITSAGAAQGVTARVRGGRVRGGAVSPRGGGPWRRRLRGCGVAGRSGRTGRSGCWRPGLGRGVPRRRRAGRPAGKGWFG